MSTDGRERTKTRKHQKTLSLHDLERLLEHELYESSPEIRKPNRTMTNIDIEEQQDFGSDPLPTEPTPSSVFRKFISPKKMLNKYRSEGKRHESNYGKHCFFWIVILALILCFSIMIIGARYFYDPEALYPPLAELPDIKFPENIQKWTFRFPQPTNRDLITISGDSKHGFYIGGSQGTFLYSTSVESADFSSTEPRTSSHCHATGINGISSEIWTWIPTSFSGTIEAINSVENLIYVRTRQSDLSIRSFFILKSEIQTTSSHHLPWIETSLGFSGNVVFGNNVWLAIDDGHLYRSIDGNVWEEVNIDVSGDSLSLQLTLLSIAFGNGRFVVLCSSLSMHYSLINPSDGSSQQWQYYVIDDVVNNQGGVTTIQFSEISTSFVALMNQRITTSDDGITWNDRFEPTTAPLENLVCSDNARCIATCNDVFIVESNSGGLSWSISYPGSNTTAYRGAYCDAEDFCLVVGDRGTIFVSSIINSWNNLGSVHHGGTDDIAIFNVDTSETLMGAPWKSSDTDDGIVISSDGVTWKEYNGGSIRYFDFLVVNSKNHWVAANRTGSFYLSPNLAVGCNWENVQKSPSSTVIQDLEATGEEFVATGFILDSFGLRHGITFYTTENGKKWNSADADAIIENLVYSPMHVTYMGIQNSEDLTTNGLYYSLDAIHWKLSHSGGFISIATDNRTGISLASDGNSLVKSTDGGWAWKEANCGDCGRCLIQTLGFIKEMGTFYQITNTSPQHIYLSNDSATTWGLLEFSYRVPIQSLSYGAGLLMAYLDGYSTNTRMGSTPKPNSGGIISIPISEMIITPCTP